MGNSDNDVEGTVVQMIPHLSCTGRHVNVCFDIGGVLLVPNLDVTHGTALDPVLFKRMMRSHAWFQYYDGNLSWSEAVRRLSLEYDVEEEHIRTFVDRARASLAPVPEMVRLVEALSATQKLKLYCMSNASAEDIDYIVTAFPDLFRHFERVFYSAAVGSSKPYHGIFHHFVHETGCKPSETIFLDDTAQNVVAAEVVGFSAVLVQPESVSDAVDLTVFHLRTDEERHTAAWEYLNRRKRGGPVESCPSLTSDGLRIQVQYDHFVIAELLHDPSFLPAQHEVPASGTFNFFPPFERAGRHNSNGSSNAKITNAVTHKNLPDDLDTTAVAMSALYTFSKVNMAAIEPVLEKMLETVTEDGQFPVYFDPLRPRVDHVVQATICHLFHLAGQSQAVQKVEATLRKVLKRRAYLLGSVYYPQSIPEVFLWRVARLAHCRSAGRSSANDRELAAFQKLVAKRVEERVGMAGSPLALAMRVLACEDCGINSSRDRKTLARMQKADGSWALCPFYTYYDPKSWIGNEVTSTAFAVAALQPSNLRSF